MNTYPSHLSQAQQQRINVVTIAGIVWLVKRLVRRDMAQAPQMPRRLT